MPIFKAGERNNLNNYCPISIIPVFSKILVKIVHKQLQSSQEYYDLLDSLQYIFRPHSSTSCAVSNTCQYIYNNFGRGSVVISIFLDFSKAFDSVDHEYLLKKISKYGIKGTALKWFRSYLTDRKQFVAIKAHNSHFSSIKSSGN